MKTLLLVSALIANMIPLIAHSQDKPLSGLVVVVDPGHGGTDPGSSRIHRSTRINESAYVYDVSLRVARLVRERGGTALLTIKDTVKVNNAPANKIMDRSSGAKFALDNSQVHAGSTGLRKRVAYGNLIARRHQKSRVVWVSIHFDVVGKLTETSGVRIISSDSSNRLTHSLSKSFDASHRLRENDPVVENGDERHGIRNLYVLSARNSIRNRVLVELGNFNNDSDAWRIRSPEVRELYAQAIVRGLESRPALVARKK